MLRRILIVLGLLAILVGVVVGGFLCRNELFAGYLKLVGKEPTTRGELLYTCPMSGIGGHPQVIQDHAGKCPICGMEVVQLKLGMWDSRSLSIDPVMVQNMGIRTQEAKAAGKGELRRTIRMVGTFTEPEQNHVEVNLRVSGWVEKLYANQENMEVRKGDPLLELYSPEITAAADELIAARKFGTDGGDAGDIARTAMAAARRKLELLGVDAGQVDAISQMDKAPRTVKVYSPITGHTTEKTVVEGAAVKAGDRVMKIADRSTMWLLVQVYEQDLSLVKAGTKVKAQVGDGENLEGTVDFIYPHLDMMTRTATARVVFSNPGHRLHEGMYARAEAEVKAGEDVADAVLVPREAVIDSGTRQVVFVMDEAAGRGHFSLREVTVGASGSMDGSETLQLLTGVKAGEKVVTSGQFLLDSESRRREAYAKYLGTRLAATMPATAPSVEAKPAVMTDPRVNRVVSEYLTLAEFLGEVGGSKPADAAGIEQAAADLAGQTEGPESSLAQQVRTTAAKMKGLGIAQQREQFVPVSAAVIGLAEKFGPTAEVAPALHIFHCLMADKNRGADWMQSTENRANPYYPKMKDCGDLVRKIVPAAPATQHEPATLHHAATAPGEGAK